MNIKWNWGTKLVIAMAMFMIMILVFVFLTTLQDHSLVEDSYYQKSLLYQDRIDKIKNSNTLKEEIEIEVVNENLSITFQSFFDPSEIEGSIHFYRPSEAKGDVKIPIKLDTSRRVVYSMKDLLKGRYIIKIDYKYHDTEYYQEKGIFVE